MYRGDKMDKSQHWGTRNIGREYEGERYDTKKRGDTDAASRSSEYKVLRRAESRESAELSQQISQMKVEDEVEEEDDEEG